MRTFMLFLCCVATLALFSQELEVECNSSVFLDLEYKDSIPFYDSHNGKIIDYLKHDWENEDVLGFDINKKFKSMLYITVHNWNEEEKHGWVYLNGHFGVYSRAYQGNLKLYKKPDYESGVACIIKEYDPEMYVVIDCKADWLKVKRVLHGKTYIGWMPPEMQCPNPYTTCS